ncbi:HNH endonuclease [Micromonospora costi]|uniref:HNH endonuclease n=2 Tax=Micromonospora costi TaxID=1530042 RepID=A0A3B0A6E8_9ACTN|nr:HNH endonuclease [Micromonospora costi]
MSAKRRAEVAAAGNPRPFSTLVNRAAPLGRAAGLDRKPTLRVTKPADTGPDAATMQVVVGRDQGCCVRCGRYVLGGERGRDWSVQHRRARQGRDARPDTNQSPNLILLCGSATTLCHGWVESYRTAARDGGWAIRQSENPALMPVDHYQYGRVWLTADGQWTRQAPAVAS